jgi:PIN domain nuclease of toxin-antitoxin system
MEGTFLLDTHTWIWLIADAGQLNSSTSQLLLSAQKERRLYGSVISIWEAANLESKGRVQLSTGIERWLEESFADDGIQLLPLSPDIAVESTRLPGDLHRDPADRILAATARMEGLTLLTRDTRLLDYGRKGHLRTRKI